MSNIPQRFNEVQTTPRPRAGWQTHRIIYHLPNVDNAADTRVTAALQHVSPLTTAAADTPAHFASSLCAAAPQLSAAANNHTYAHLRHDC